MRGDLTWGAMCLLGLGLAWTDLTQAEASFSYSGYIRTHLSVNLQDAPELVPRRDGPFFSLGSRLNEVDFEEAGGQGEPSMIRHTLKLDGLLDLGFAQVAGVVRVVKETRTDFERRLQTSATAFPLRALDGTVSNGGLVGSTNVGALDAISAVAPLLYAATEGDTPPTAGSLLAVTDSLGGGRGEAILAGCDVGLCGGRRFFDEYDSQQLRELFVQFDIGPYVHFRLGKQQVVWGETDFFRAMDIIGGCFWSWKTRNCGSR